MNGQSQSQPIRLCRHSVMGKSGVEEFKFSIVEYTRIRGKQTAHEMQTDSGFILQFKARTITVF